MTQLPLLLVGNLSFFNSLYNNYALNIWPWNKWNPLNFKNLRYLIFQKRQTQVKRLFWEMTNDFNVKVSDDIKNKLSLTSREVLDMSKK